MARPYRARRWRPATPDPAACWLLSRNLNLSPVTAQVLYNRGLTTPEAAHAFLTAGREQILDPFLLKDMDRAVALIHQQIRSGRPIMVYGDYDVDGVTGTTILVLALRALGATVAYYIPDRFAEGYGLNEGALRQIHQRGFDFVLSVDTGITAVKEAEVARELGITLVISDHHEPGPTLPEAPAVINPKRPDCDYPFKGLSGVGVAFKLALALGAPNAWELLDIVTLGTIADMVPLVGENRAIVREGLKALDSTTRPGLCALMEVAGVRRPVTATHIGFALGPRINALGRMGSAMEGVELLTTANPVRARELARFLDEQNRSRQETEAAILQEALQQAERQAPHEREYVLVLAGEGWHHGVVGICASRVLEAYHRPSILLSIEGDEVRGSARSIPAFHMQRALLQVSDLFSKFGGHAAAAGMTLKHREDIPVLRERLNRLAAQWLRPEDLVPELQVDAFIGLDDVTDQLMAELHQLEPHGTGNPAPVFGLKDLTVLETRKMGKEMQHLKVMLKGDGLTPVMEAVGWGMAPACPSVSARVQVAAQPEYDTYGGRQRLRLTLKDLQVVASPDNRGFPVNMVEMPELPEEACLRWDPLAGLTADAPGSVPLPPGAMDGRGKRLAEALAALTAPQPDVAATAEDPAAEEEAHDHEAPEPSRRLYLEALAAAPDSRILVLTASPWAATGLVAELQAAMPDRRREVVPWLPGQPEPAGGAIIVAPYGCVPQGAYTDCVLYHPPYHGGQVPAGQLHLIWQDGDWELAEASLSWAYPDRDVLVTLYKLLKAGKATPRELARALAEPWGAWNRLRLEAGLTVFREVGLVGPDGSPVPVRGGSKFDLEASPRYRLGMAGREALRALRTDDWPSGVEAL